MSTATPTADPKKPIACSQRYFARATGVGPESCCGKLFMNSQAAMASNTMIGTQANVAF